MSARTTLGLDDDLDSVELLIAVERAFDVKISNEEAERVSTMGDLHDLVASKLEGAGGEMCRTSMSFYRVRRALKAVLGDIDIRPDTALSAIWRGSPKALIAQTQRHCELRLASPSATAVSGIGAVLIVAVIFGAPILVIAQINGWLILALAGAVMGVGFALTRLDPLSFAPNMLTAGDLARRTATQNYGALIGMGARTDAQAIWDALVEVAWAFSEALPVEAVDRDTILLQSQFDAARKRA